MSSPAPRTSSASLHELQRYARFLDSSFRIPGTTIRFGLDPIVGLIPGIGDAAGLVLGSWILLRARQHGVGRGTLMRMLGNMVFEAVVGSVPVLGDAFDVWFKANRRNVALLESYLRRQEPQAVPPASSQGTTKGRWPAPRGAGKRP